MFAGQCPFVARHRRLPDQLVLSQLLLHQRNQLFLGIDELDAVRVFVQPSTCNRPPVPCHRPHIPLRWEHALVRAQQHCHQIQWWHAHADVGQVRPDPGARSAYSVATRTFAETGKQLATSCGISAPRRWHGRSSQRPHISQKLHRLQSAQRKARHLGPRNPVSHGPIQVVVSAAAPELAADKVRASASLPLGAVTHGAVGRPQLPTLLWIDLSIEQRLCRSLCPGPRRDQQHGHTRT